MRARDVQRLMLGTFVRPPEETGTGAPRVEAVFGYLVRHDRGHLLLDTGLGRGDQQTEDWYRPRRVDLVTALASAGAALSDVDVVVNCHLHADHAGQNATFRAIPIHVQPAERAAARDPDYTIQAWVDGPEVIYREIAGDHELVPGIRVLATPGHSPGHQSLLVETDEGPTILAGQALYSVGEWTGRAGAREGRSHARDLPRYDASVAKLRAIDPVRVWFGHDRATWSRDG